MKTYTDFIDQISEGSIGKMLYGTEYNKLLQKVNKKVKNKYVSSMLKSLEADLKKGSLDEGFADTVAYHITGGSLLSKGSQAVHKIVVGMGNDFEKAIQGGNTWSAVKLATKLVIIGLALRVGVDELTKFANGVTGADIAKARKEIQMMKG